MRRVWVAGLIVAVAAAFVRSAPADETLSSHVTQQLPQEKQTSLRLYLTSREAFNRWNSSPERVKILDVRTPEEYIFVGHAEMAWNVPFAFQSYRWDADKQRFAMEPNTKFVSQVQKLAQPADTIFVMCRSGGRSALAVNLLAKSGFKRVFNIVDGMEGDSIDDPESVFHGKRMKNGWKNSGLPWTYNVSPVRVRLPNEHSRTK